MFSSKGNNNKKGEIQLIIGPMSSGKSTELNLSINKYRVAGCRCFIIEQPTGTVRSKRSSLESYLDVIDQYDVIGIDDGHCYDTISSFSSDLADKGKIVIVAGRDSTPHMKGYSNLLKLVPLAEKVNKLQAVCVQCRHDASFIQLKQPVSQVIEESNCDLPPCEPVCRKCHSSGSQSVTPPVKVTPQKENVKPLSLDLTVVKSPNVSNTRSVVCDDSKSGPATLANTEESFSPPPLSSIKSTVNRTKLFSTP
ncbi:thymidine kinase 1-like [Argonauta hians]